MDMIRLIPLLVILTSMASLYMAIAVYRVIYPYEDVKRALEIASEYRSLTVYLRSKRAARKARSLEPEYKRARGLILRTILVKFTLITLSYISTALLVTLVMPAVEVPYHIPLVTFNFENCPLDESRGCVLMPTLYLHFFAFIYAMLLLRESML